MTTDIFNDYARMFAKFTTPYQLQAYEAVISFLNGRVLDAGCGPAKLSAFIPMVGAVKSYLGVDNCEPMVKEGRKLLGSLKRKNYDIRYQSIEETTETFDTVVSVQSYYAWSDAMSTLQHLNRQTVTGGALVLVTANNQLDIDFLIRQCSRAYVLDPDWDQYVKYNQTLATLPTGRYVSLDTLIGEVRDSGYQVVHTDTTLFDGGVNLVVGMKPTS